MTRRMVSSAVLSCREAEAELALQVGGDLDDSARTRLLVVHLASCPHCRDYQRRLAECVEVIQFCASESLPSYRTGGIWPRVAAKLPPCNPRPVLARFNVWVPTTAMAVACAAMIFVTVIQLNGLVPADPAALQSWTAVSSGPSRDYFSDPVFKVRDDQTALLPLYLSTPNGQNLSPVGWGRDGLPTKRSQQPLRFSPRGEF